MAKQAEQLESSGPKREPQPLSAQRVSGRLQTAQEQLAQVARAQQEAGSAARSLCPVSGPRFQAGTSSPGGQGTGGGPGRGREGAGGAPRKPTRPGAGTSRSHPQVPVCDMLRSTGRDCKQASTPDREPWMLFGATDPEPHSPALFKLGHPTKRTMLWPSSLGMWISGVAHKPICRWGGPAPKTEDQARYVDIG